MLDLRGRKVLVVGMARSGTGAAILAHRLGATVLASDKKPAALLGTVVADLNRIGIETETGGHQRAATEAFDLVVLSPGVAPDCALHESWQQRGTPVWSELELAAQACDGAWIGVTGSNGKTTTVHLITAILQHAGMDAVMAGNVGTAWSCLLPAPPSRVFVVEVSSFQLEHAFTLRPHVAVFLNLFENHLDRHGDMETYAQLKAKLFRNQQPTDIAVVCGDDERISRLAPSFPARIVRFGTDARNDFWSNSHNLMMRIAGEEHVLLAREELPLIGRHNELNAVAAAAAAFHFGVPVSHICGALRAAAPVEHRIEFVACVNGVKYFNDSKSTNMVATMTALDAFEHNVILLFGGRPKKESFRSLAARIPHPVRAIVAYGEAVPQLRRELPPATPVTYVESFEDAVRFAARIARAGDVVLLSPGCTSFDQFDNFEERGRAFKRIVSTL